jgi:hypothetical protein
MPAAQRPVDSLVALLDEAFQRKSWHGTNLRGSLRGISAAEAAWKPNKNRKCIWEHTLHTAYWKYVIRRKLTGEKRGAFELQGSNWIALPADRSEASWRASIGILENEHRRLREAVAALDERALAAHPDGSAYPAAYLIRGIALHDIYHTGQIQLLKRMFSSS